ncbi:hypothetical protein QBC42DRAFT_249353 [Cladorrhinum samala]|uniref:Uncharacterized protein n=1 Tax=Cladorrhinum samala TaxID=585594 RepID=A0AAV9HXJ6_9PEZI|nr:hypothetical protein QBC42DRAFT_249353 [Cladorrhinum samala]
MSVPPSPAGGGTTTTTPLQPMSHNSQRDRESILFSPTHSTRGRGLTLGAVSDNGRDSSVHEKINQFNSLAVQSKQLERKTADAALKRAMLGREEAEAEMRRYRDEARSLRKQIEEGKERERKVGERLETVMESYGRAKETHEHTKELWEKEIRRARKETFKTQSACVKLQEELKAARINQKAIEQELRREKQTSSEQAQEVFTAKSQLSGLQEQLAKAEEQIKVLEQARDELKTLTAEQEEEIKRLSSERKTRESSPSSEQLTPRKRPRTASMGSSSSDVPDFEELTRLYQWEKQRADRAVQQVRFLETECHLKVCPAAKALRRSSHSRSRRSSPRRKRMSLLKVGDAGDALILQDSPRKSPEPRVLTPKRSKTDLLRQQTAESRPSAVFVPSEGIFRTVSSQAEASAAGGETEVVNKSVVPPPHTSPTDPITRNSPVVQSDYNSNKIDHPPQRRSPSVDLPDEFTMLDKDRTSLLSLLDAPHHESGPEPVFNIPTVPGPDPGVQAWQEPEREPAARPVNTYREASAPLTEPISSTRTRVEPPAARPHTTASFYGSKLDRYPNKLTITTTTTTTTTKVPLKEETDDPSLAQRIMKAQKTPVRGEDEGPSFDVNNPALTPTMTREEALAQIRERRVRARSVGKPENGGNSSGRVTPGGSTSGRVTPGAGSGRVTPGVGSGRVTPGVGSGRVTPGANSGRVTPGAPGSGRVTPGVGSGRVTPGGTRNATAERGRQREISTQSAPTTYGGAKGTGAGGMGVRRTRS